MVGMDFRTRTPMLYDDDDDDDVGCFIHTSGQCFFGFCVCLDVILCWLAFHFDCLKIAVIYKMVKRGSSLALSVPFMILIRFENCIFGLSKTGRHGSCMVLTIWKMFLLFDRRHTQIAHSGPRFEEQESRKVFWVMCFFFFFYFSNK